ncbi:MAG: cobyric acid synthase [Acidobacteria bacterium]|nr:cobyric acid synthase [Acidobacteriota bacterium]
MSLCLMVGGAASHVGKSWMTAAICRWLYRRGMRVAPFKAQNMSNNSYPCRAGGEIGRAQVAQAEACGLEPEPDMNPILLKPTGDAASQVVVQGKVWRDLGARAYYERFDELLAKAAQSFERLRSRFDVVVLEGAGSIAELNLRRTDLVNLGFAGRYDIPVLLVADIDRGGVFAAVHGTIDLLEPSERRLVRSFAVNRFRGDPTLFEDGVRILEEKTRKPCLGVFPYAQDIHLDEEDGVRLDDLPARRGAAGRVAILRFPRISNLTDFRLLPGAAWVDRPVAEEFDVVILPGTKNTLGDLAWLRSRGLDAWVHARHAAGATILGVCGGYQMLGERVKDPHGVESDRGGADGLGLLPVRTTLAVEKVTQVVQGVTNGGAAFGAYEIHMGQTSPTRPVESLCSADGRPEGARAGNCLGTYLHGALETPDVLREWLGLTADAVASKEESYDRLADWFENAVDVGLFERLYLGRS